MAAVVASATRNLPWSFPAASKNNIINNSNTNSNSSSSSNNNPLASSTMPTFAAPSMMLPRTALEVGVWECFLEEANKWEPYPWPANSILEQAYCQSWHTVEFTSRGIRYEAKLASPSPVPGMVQVNASTGKQRKIRRWASLASKAVHLEQSRKRLEHCMQADHVWVLFPQSQDALNLEDGPLEGLLAREKYNLGTQLTFSEAWWPDFMRASWGRSSQERGGHAQQQQQHLTRAFHPLGSPCNFAVHRLKAPIGDLNRVGVEWAAIMRYWNTQPTRLVGALRIQSRHLLHGFAAAREAMLARLNEDGNEETAGQKLQVKLLWHGTKSIENLLDVCNEGFDRAHAHSCLYGKGCYFAKTSSYSENYSCHVSIPCESRPCRAMILAAVLVGECVQGTRNMYPPPVKGGSKCGERYENAVDNVSDPQIFVTFKDYQAVPLYVVVFS
mmetsp:Transcript_76739/g.167673  ORF Transcript_76739/g.167673 Transcript_76739/m.167673 type:complete len:443 (-) Transcript_76739:60-1388(-)